MSVGPEFYLFMYAVLIGVVTLFISILVVLIRDIRRMGTTAKLANTSSRLVAFAIDVTIILIFVDTIVWLIQPMFWWPLNLVFILSNTFLAAFIVPPLAFQLFFQFYLLFFLFPNRDPIAFYSIMLVTAGFLYFFIAGAFGNGKSIGKLLLKIRTISTDDTKRLTFKQAFINSLGKSFLLFFDIVVGMGFYIGNKENNNNIRITQRFAKTIVINERFQEFQHDSNMESGDDDSY